MLKTVISLTLTTLVSVLIGLLFVSNFWIAFTLAFILQILFFYFFNTIYENKLIEKAQMLRLEEFKEQNRHVLQVQCPCDQKSRQDVELRFDADVVYQCNSCKKNIKTLVDVKTVLTTEPIYFNE